MIILCSTNLQMLPPKEASSVQYTKEYQILIDMPIYFSLNLYKKIDYGHYNIFSIIDKNDQDRKRFAEIFKIMKQKSKFQPELLGLENQQISRGVACLLGLGISDALGASTEFIPFNKKRKGLIVNGFQGVKQRIKQCILDTRDGKIGIWTDDCSMALCIADSLLLQNYKFDPQHIRFMFTMWLEHGLNNGGRPQSIGIGEDIAISMTQFMKKQTNYAVEGDCFNNGNGSLMRLAPIPIAYQKKEEQAMKNSQLQSRTTHNGDQAKQCARLLALILVRLINRPKNETDWRATINKACSDFKTDNKAVEFLAASKKQTKEMFKEAKENFKEKFTKFNKSADDRDWNWKDENFTYSLTRTKQQPGYIGSYCMDALSMAMHTVWHRKSFDQIAHFSANIGGDCDTVGAIAGQIAGAIYGVDKDMLELYSQMIDFQSGRYDLFLKAYKLAHRKQLSL